MIFIDTGAYLRRFLKTDQYHSRSAAAWNLLKEQLEPCYTSNFVLDETITFLARRAGYSFAAQRALQLYTSNELHILRPLLEDELTAINVFEKFADQEVSFTACVSFGLMQKAEIKRVFSFDRHFERAGFELWPA